ncbi:DUF1565 domain-containing protein [Engelhardtia mirabilis]|uniref:DUF1565 domain-containing protein n=1 Tax=Engelhardtia mirabilis TaxID=2528011 RepID=A0A518BPQ9_9BACT|nr:hypothetical protein Pla133_40750 [Planctomycetes bacterium Pla133]QDV03287.1 hypothetical protein Pla86_40740 [Planctomycetes bacterium Pla86]
MKLIAPLAALLTLAAPSFADTLFVDAVTGDDQQGLGSPTAPFATVTKAVAALGAQPGPHTIRVAPGVYNVALGESFPIQLPKDTELQGAGHSLCTISGEGDGTLLRMDRGVLITDFTVQRGDVGILSAVPGFTIMGPERHVRRCVVRQCTVGIRMTDALHTDYGLVVTNSVITGNIVGLEAEVTGNDFQSCSLLVYGCTITDNLQGLNASKPGFGAELYLTLSTSILRGNGDDSIAGWAGAPTVQGCVLEDSSSFVGQDGNQAFDPQLPGGFDDDAHLKVTSPAVDMGGPAVAWPPSVQWVGTSGWAWEPAFAATLDIDLGPRVSELDIDPGADERRPPTLYLLGKGKVGGSIQTRMQADAFDPAAIYLGLDVLPAPLGGLVWLAPPQFAMGSVVLDAGGLGGLTLPIPNDPVLIGLDVWFQGFRIGATGLGGTTPKKLRILP